MVCCACFVFLVACSSDSTPSQKDQQYIKAVSKDSAIKNADESFSAKANHIQEQEEAAPANPVDMTALVTQGYAKGVPMGGTVVGATKAPTLNVWAAKDQTEANLDRIQIIKDWVDSSGEQHEKLSMSPGPMSANPTATASCQWWEIQLT